MLLTLTSFGKSFRVGIDADEPDELVTSGVFAFTRNPIYVAFGIVLLGEFLILPHWILLVYLVGGIALFHRQVLREEDYLASHYGEAYGSYRQRVPRYF
jgi:protein-S-isoprenylcysteine O-methyltransferase Ste14